MDVYIHRAISHATDRDAQGFNPDFQARAGRMAMQNLQRAEACAFPSTPEACMELARLLQQDIATHHVRLKVRPAADYIDMANKLSLKLQDRAGELA